MAKGFKDKPRRKKPSRPLQLCFTKKDDGLLGVLATPVVVLEHITDHLPGTHQKRKELGTFTGIWDTGANGSAITQKVVDDCGLVQTGKKEVRTAGGAVHAPTYLVSFGLPSGVAINNVRVTKLPISGADILIGMDIIAKGDFAVTHRDNETIFTFGIPSVRRLDFVKEKKTFTPPPAPATKQPPSSSPPSLPPASNPGRNQPCPCGSGLKYKKCCGKGF